MKAINVSLVPQHAVPVQEELLAHLASMDTSCKMVYVYLVVVFPIMPTRLQGHVSLQGAAAPATEKTQQIRASRVAQLAHSPTMLSIVVMLVHRHAFHVPP